MSANRAVTFTSMSGGKLVCVLHRGRGLDAMLPRDGIDGVTGAHGEDSEQRFLVLGTPSGGRSRAEWDPMFAAR